MNDLIKERAEAFEKANAHRFDEKDIEWKPTYRKNRQTGQSEESGKLAYLNWATAWETMKKFYPDCNFEVLDHDGDPLFNVNGYGMVKVSVSALGVTHTEVFPIMHGGANEATVMEEIDARDINDSIQRAVTKACARFGVGLYIYQGKLKEPKEYKECPNPRPAVIAASVNQKKFIQTLLQQKGVALSTLSSKPLDELSTQEANAIINRLKELPNPPQNAPRNAPVTAESVYKESVGEDTPF